MLKTFPKDLLVTLRLMVVLTVVCCFAYTYAVTGVANVLFPSQAAGSLITHNGQVVGSQLIGQAFTQDKYFQGRPSPTVSETDATKAAPYNAQNSSGSNLAPSNQALVDRVRQAVADLKKANPTLSGDVPVDLVTGDFAGLDPYISPASAELQVPRIAAARKLDPAKVMALVQAHTDGRTLGMMGEPHVNVLALNLALDDGAAG